MLYRGPAGETINVVRYASSGTAEDFIALSSTCPHLGCQVHWEPYNDRYFCPCHNGVFDPEGAGVSGPPGDAGQSLPRYRLSIEDGLLFIEVPVGGFSADAGASEQRAGIDRDPTSCDGCGPRRSDRNRA
ncbi:MAG TPA: Rieske 2Fe-2S domain-containing protein [Acidobacteriota bacterium]|nr:Rieske 2Fe-2S domain-containing protein [Acidobacteriota bacterium]